MSSSLKIGPQALERLVQDAGGRAAARLLPPPPNRQGPHVRHDHDQPDHHQEARARHQQYPPQAPERLAQTSPDRSPRQQQDMVQDHVARLRAQGQTEAEAAETEELGQAQLSQGRRRRHVVGQGEERVGGKPPHQTSLGRKRGFWDLFLLPSPLSSAASPVIAARQAQRRLGVCQNEVLHHLRSGSATQCHRRSFPSPGNMLQRAFERHRRPESAQRRGLATALEEAQQGFHVDLRHRELTAGALHPN
eukprot:scaffold834_cov244-Pinguiococcus_pyrenoidosus.AAC.13